ncbi:MAG TPA: diguanylate cyclase [Rubrivivax sp.]|nr:diguanylate cyclase [Rubrivivax sp.]
MTPPVPAAAALFDQMADAVYLLDPETSTVLWANRAAWAVLGLTREEVLDHSVLSLQKDVRGLPQWTAIAAAIRQQTPYVFVGRHRHRDGHEVPVEVVTTTLMQDGREYFLSVARDVTRRLELEAELQRREPALWFALNEAADGLWDWTLADNSLFFSPQLQRMLGYGPDEMPPRLETWTSNIHPDDSAQVLRSLHDHLEGRRNRYLAEYRLRNRNGHYLWVRDSGRVSHRDAAGQPTRVVGMVHDITEQKMLQFKLEDLAANDTLTGLPNRRRGQEFLDSQIALCTRLGLTLGLCFIDLDFFKAVNDEHGHLKGDEVLRAVAQALAAATRRSDLLFRWGGEEFALVCPGADLQEMQQVAHKLRQALSAMPWQTRLNVRPLTASMGIALFPRHAREGRALLELADSALFRAKAAQRDRVEVADDSPPSP